MWRERCSAWDTPTHSPDPPAQCFLCTTPLPALGHSARAQVSWTTGTQDRIGAPPGWAPSQGLLLAASSGAWWEPHSCCQPPLSSGLLVPAGVGLAPLWGVLAGQLLEGAQLCSVMSGSCPHTLHRPSGNSQGLSGDGGFVLFSGAFCHSHAHSELSSLSTG